MHKDADIVTGMLVKIKEIFGSNKVIPITETIGKVHDYLGMIIDYSYPSEVKFTMYEYIMQLFEELSPEMRWTSTSPAAAHLIQVNELEHKAFG